MARLGFSDALRLGSQTMLSAKAQLQPPVSHQDDEAPSDSDDDTPIADLLLRKGERSRGKSALQDQASIPQQTAATTRDSDNTASPLKVASSLKRKRASEAHAKEDMTSHLEDLTEVVDETERAGRRTARCRKGKRSAKSKQTLKSQSTISLLDPENEASSHRLGVRIEGRPETVTIDLAYVRNRIATLHDTGIMESELYLSQKPNSARTYQLPPLDTFDCDMIYRQFTTNGQRFTGGLFTWLRSASVLPLMKMWHRECKYQAAQAQLKTFLPQDPYQDSHAWEQRLSQIVELAKLPDAGRSKAGTVDGAVISCAIYAKKLLAQNHTILAANGAAIDFGRQSAYGVSVAVILAVHYDILNMPKKSIFARLLGSELARPMHADIRAQWDTKYTFKGGNLCGDDLATICVPLKATLKLKDATPVSEATIRQQKEAFTDREEMAFLLALLDIIKADEDTAAPMLERAYDFIGEIPPGRTVKECEEYFEDYKASLVGDPEE